ncbi:MAG: DUF1574 family protein, partial [Pseudomonadota bacterium]|nr:DUF1574 family protein [Pseudomonadota bacterium]
LRRYLWLGNKHVLPINGEIETRAKKAYDGSHIYNESFVNQADNIREGFPRLINYAMKNFDYDIESIEKLENFILYLKSNNVTVTLILSPYHPKLYQLMRTQKPKFLEIEAWYREFAKRNDIRIIGTYDGNTMGCKENEFYDGMHPKKSCMQKLFLDVNK